MILMDVGIFLQDCCKKYETPQASRISRSLSFLLAHILLDLRHGF
jgi:hypothetical protein